MTSALAELAVEALEVLLRGDLERAEHEVHAHRQEEARRDLVPVNAANGGVRPGLDQFGEQRLVVHRGPDAQVAGHVGGAVHLYATGVAEPVVVTSGTDRIVVEVPGKRDESTQSESLAALVKKTMGIELKG